MFVAPRLYTESDARAAIAASRSWAESLRRLGICSTGGSWKVLKKWAAIWEIPTDHFDSAAARIEGLARHRREPRPLEALLVEGSVVKSATLKERLYAAGLKERRCEICGQSEEWCGRRMSLVLDHVNGKHDDNRLENLRIVCPNCNATLDTHCGRNARNAMRACARCGRSFRPKRPEQRHCSLDCGQRHDRRGRPNPGARKVERPSSEQLVDDLVEMSWEAVGRKYGVSGNAVRKWARSWDHAEGTA